MGDGKLGEFVQELVKEKVPEVVRTVLEEQLERRLEPVTKQLEEVLAQEKRDDDTDIVNPNEERWKGAEPPKHYQRAIEEGGFEGRFIRSSEGLYWNPDEEARAAGYRPPATKAGLGVRAGRTLRALVAANFDSDKVPAVLSDRYKDPETARLAERALETTQQSTGGLFIVHPLLVGELIPLLYDKMVLMQLGAREFTMGAGGAIIPGLEQGVNGGWVGELQEPDAELPVMFSKKLSSKEAFALVAMSRSLLEEASVSVDQIVANDLVRAMALVIENAGLNGLGTEHSPRGIFHDPGIHVTDLDRALTADDPIDFDTLLEEEKVDFQGRRMGYAVPPVVKGAFKKMKTTTGDYLYLDELKGENPRLMDHPLRSTTLINRPLAAQDSERKVDILFGDFAEFLIGVTRAMTVERSNEASYKDENGNRRSGFIQGVSLIKVTEKVDTTMRNSKTMLKITNIHTA